jgi:hypothetical protein
METQEQINFLQSQILQLESRLSEKDYMTIREQEGGEPMPDDIKVERAQFRLMINQLQDQIAILQATLIEEEQLNMEAPNDH